jgi:hypothetical protein
MFNNKILGQDIKWINMLKVASNLMTNIEPETLELTDTIVHMGDEHKLVINMLQPASAVDYYEIISITLTGPDGQHKYTVANEIYAINAFLFMLINLFKHRG